MSARCTDRSTSRAAAAQEAKVLAAQQALTQEEPMHRYPHPIPTCSTPTAASGSAASADLDRILEQLSCQSQLLVDLLGAVNSLTAATLSQNNRS